MTVLYLHEDTAPPPGLPCAGLEDLPSGEPGATLDEFAVSAVDEFAVSAVDEFAVSAVDEFAASAVDEFAASAVDEFAASAVFVNCVID